MSLRRVEVEAVSAVDLIALVPVKARSVAEAASPFGQQALFED